MRTLSQFFNARFFIAALSVIVLAGCASRYPEPIRTDATDLLRFEQAQRQSEQVTGSTARWGGVIASVENRDQGTRIEVVNFPLNNFGRPLASDRSDGRFVVYLDRFVDPEIYQRGRMITALGQFSGTEQGQIGDFNYYYPVLQASGVELWRQQNRPQTMIHLGYGYYDPHSLWYRNHIYGVGPYRYYYHPYYRPWGPRPVRVIQQRPPRQQQQPGAAQGRIDDMHDSQGVVRPQRQQY